MFNSQKRTFSRQIGMIFLRTRGAPGSPTSASILLNRHFPIGSCLVKDNIILFCWKLFG